MNGEAKQYLRWYGTKWDGCGDAVCPRLAKTSTVTDNAYSVLLGIPTLIWLYYSDKRSRSMHFNELYCHSTRYNPTYIYLNNYTSPVTLPSTFHVPTQFMIQAYDSGRQTRETYALASGL